MSQIRENYTKRHINQFLEFKMISRNNRVLRERRLKDYSTTEIIDGEFYGSFRSQQQKSNPETQQTNANARILVKFLNQVNRSMLSHHNLELSSHTIKNQTHEPAKRKLVKTEYLPSKTPTMETNKGENFKKTQPSRISELNKSSMISESKQKKEIKEMNAGSIKKPNQVEKHTISSSGRIQNQINADYMKMWNQFTEKGRKGRKTQQQIMSRFQQIQKKNIENQLGKTVPQEPIKSEVQFEQKEIKCFKTQAFHVAIAYQIHLKLSNPNELGNIDPTYNAKKLKQKAKVND